MRASALFTGALGVKAHERALTSVADNISNVSTYGYKGTRALFSDLMSRQLVQGGRESDVAGYAAHNQIGLGVVAHAVNVMNAAALTETSINTDLGVNGQGFFIVKAPLHYSSPFGTVYGADDNGGSKPGSVNYYTRNGAFHVDKHGYITNDQGYVLQGVLADADGIVTMGPLQDLRIPEDACPSRTTSRIDLNLNLDAGDKRLFPDSVAIDPNDATTYNYANSSTVYDENGKAHNLMMFYQRVEPMSLRAWKVSVYEKTDSGFTKSAITNGDFRLNFTDTGKLDLINNPTADRFVSNLQVAAGQQLSTVMGQNLQFNGAAGVERFIIGGNITFSSGTVAGQNVTIGGKTYTLSNNTSREEAAAELASLINANSSAAGCFAINTGSGELTIQPLQPGNMNMAYTGSGISTSAGATLEQVVTAIDSGAQAHGSLMINNLLAAGQTLTIGGQTYTIPSGATLEEMASAIAQQINNQSSATVSATAQGNGLYLTAKDSGTAGNMLFSSSDSAGYLSLSAATLLGGMNGSNFSQIDAQVVNDKASGKQGLALQRIGAGVNATISGLNTNFTPSGSSGPLTFSKTASAGNTYINTNGEANLTFNFNGTPKQVVMDFTPPGRGATTQQAVSSETYLSDQDGYAQGAVNGLQIDDYGNVLVSFTNNQIQRVGTIALAHFRGLVELERIGDNLWLANDATGEALIDFPATEQYGMGNIQSYFLEKSNVDMGQELVNMITYQRAYQFNTKSITTNDEMLKEAINMKR